MATSLSSFFSPFLAELADVISVLLDPPTLQHPPPPHHVRWGSCNGIFMVAVLGQKLPLWVVNKEDSRFIVLGRGQRSFSNLFAVFC